MSMGILQPTAPSGIIGALVGATAVGKTALALDLARELQAEIISADSCQVYQGVEIGSAQPSAEQLRTVPHHFVGFREPSLGYSVGEFLQGVRALLQQNPHKKFLVVGGTGMYVKVLQEGISTMPAANEHLRNRLLNLEKRKGLAALYRCAGLLDAAACQRVIPTDRHRILRILEVYLQSGLPWSSFLGQRKGGLGPFPVVWIDRPRDELYARIDRRVLEMINMGWEKEIARLVQKAGADCVALQSLGCAELMQANQGVLPREQAIALVQRNTRNFAKRQITWFRHQLECQRVDLSVEKEGLILASLKEIFTK